MVLLLFTYVEHAIMAVVVAMLFGAWSRGGLQGIVELLVSWVANLPGYKLLVSVVIGGQVKDYVNKLRGSDDKDAKTVSAAPSVKLPEKGKNFCQFHVFTS